MTNFYDCEFLFMCLSNKIDDIKTFCLSAQSYIDECCPTDDVRFNSVHLFSCLSSLLSSLDTDAEALYDMLKEQK